MRRPSRGNRPEPRQWAFPPTAGIPNRQCHEKCGQTEKEAWQVMSLGPSKAEIARPSCQCGNWLF